MCLSVGRLRFTGAVDDSRRDCGLPQMRQVCVKHHLARSGDRAGRLPHERRREALEQYVERIVQGAKCHHRPLGRILLTPRRALRRHCRRCLQARSRWAIGSSARDLHRAGIRPLGDFAAEPGPSRAQQAHAVASRYAGAPSGSRHGQRTDHAARHAHGNRGGGLSSGQTRSLRWFWRSWDGRRLAAERIGVPSVRAHAHERPRQGSTMTHAGMRARAPHTEAPIAGA